MQHHAIVRGDGSSIYQILAAPDVSFNGGC